MNDHKEPTQERAWRALAILALVNFCISAFAAWQTATALETGVVKLRGPEIYLSHSPFWYWTITAGWACVTFAPWVFGYRLYKKLRSNKESDF